MERIFRIMIGVILCGNFALAGAQEVIKKDSIQGFNAMDYLIQDRYRYPDKGFMNKHWMDNMYFQIGGGLFNPNRTGEVPMKWMQDYHLSLGKNLTSKHGLRVGFNYGKGRLKEENLGVKRYMLHLDHLFNVSAYIMGYDPDRAFEISTVMGAGIQETRAGEEKHRAPEGHLGLELKYKVGPQSFLTFEPMVQITDGYKQDNWRHVGLSSGATLNYIQYLRPLTTDNTNSSKFTKMSPFFIELATGLQFQNPDFGAWASRGGSYATYVGKWLSDGFGVRTGVNGSFNRVKSVRVDGMNQHQDAAYLDGRFDLLLNPLGLFTTNGPKSWGGFHLLGGILYGYANPYDGREGYSYSGYSTGVQGWLRIQDNLQLFLEPRMSFIESEQESPVTKELEEVYETLYNLNVGLRLNYSTWDERKSRYLRNDLFQPSFFVQAAGGVSYSALRQSMYAGNGGADYSGRISAGYRFTPYHGLRANMDYTHIQSKDAYGRKFNDNLTTLSLDYMLGLSNVMQEGYDQERSLSVDVYAGPVWNLESSLFGAHAGTMVKKKLNAHTSLFVMPEMTFLPKDEHEVLLQHDWNPFFNVYAGVEYSFKGGKDFINGLFPKARNVRAGSHFPFFVETGVGASAMINSSVEWKETIGNTFRTAVGHWINPAVAARLSAEAAWNPMGNDSHRYLLLGGADVLYNPFGMSSSYKYDSSMGLNVVAGGNLGWQKATSPKQEMVYGFGGGIQLWTKLMQHTRFFVEPRYSHLWTDNTADGGKGYLSAQLGVTMDYVVPKRRNSYPSRKEFEDKGLFFQLGGGLMTNLMQLGSNGHVKDLNSVWGIGAGYRFTPLSAVRLGIDSQKFNEGETREDRLAASLAYMLNLNTLLSGYEPDRRFSTELYAGPLGYYNLIQKEWMAGGLLGLQFGFRMNDRMALHFSPELHAAFKSDHSDKRVAYKMGLTYQLNGKGRNMQALDWFFDASTGVQQLTNAPLEAQNTLGQIHKLSVGTWMNSLVGVRFAGTASVNRWMHKNETSSLYLQYYAFQPSVIFDPLSLIPAYDREDAKAGIYLVGGPEMGVTVMEKNLEWNQQYTTGLNVGVQGWMKIGEHQRLFIEPMYSQTSIDRMGVNVGLSLDMGKVNTSWDDVNAFKHFYVQMGAGSVSDIYNRNRYMKPTFRPSYEFTAGYRIDPLSSIRFSLGHTPGKKNVSLQDSDLSAAYQLNLSNLFLGENTNRRLDLEAFAGISCIKVDDLVLSIGSVVGMQANYHLNDNFYLYVSPEARIVHSKYKTLFGVGYKW